MTPVNILDIKDRAQFRQWLIENHATERECWVVAKRGKTPPEDALWYLDAVEEALCFGWIDSTLKINLDKGLQNIVTTHWKNGGKIAAICAAPALVLGPLGIISETTATGYPSLKEEFEKNGGTYSEDNVVVTDRLITSKGPGTTLEFALAIVRKAKGEATEKALREGMVIA